MTPYRTTPDGVEYDSDIFGTVTFPVVTMDEIASGNRERMALDLERRREEAFGDWYDTYGHASFTDLDAPDGVMREVSSYCNRLMDDDGRKGVGLMLFGGNGVGKTYCAAVIANEALRGGKRVAFTSVRDLISMMPYGSDPKVLNRLVGYDLVVLDDLGAERSTATGSETAFSVVDKLYSRKVPTVVTTNLSKSQISNPDAQSRRMMDRLKERCRIVEYRGRNRRQERIGE